MDGYRSAQGAPDMIGGGSGMSRAERFEDEKRRIVDSCFGRTNPDGSLLESYITHIRIIEDASYPSSPPPPTSNPDVKKPRLIVVAVRNSGRVRMHKARENANGTFSIGKTWPLDDLTAVESFNGSNPTNFEAQNRKLWAGGAGFIVTIGKPYYWQANSQKEKQFFVASLVKIYLKYTGGKSPELIGFDDSEREQLLGISPAQSRVSPATVIQSRPPTQAIPVTSSTANQRQLRGPTSREPVLRQPVNQDPMPRSMPQDMPSSASTSLNSQTSRPAIQSRREGSPGSSIDYNGVTPQQSQPSLRRLAAGNQSQESFGRSDDSSLPPRSRGGTNGLPSSSGRFPDRSITPASLRTGTPDSISSNTKDVIADAPPVPAPLALPPERRRPPMPTAGDNVRLRNKASNDNMIPAPLMSPAIRRDDKKVPQRSADRELSSNKTEANSAFVGVSGKSSRYNSPQQSLDATKDMENFQTLDNVTTPQFVDPAAPPPMEPPPEPKDEDRPGLGPMIKKKSKADIASQFRKAASAANAFKPRAGGAAERLLQQSQTKSEGPDGITGVVPAPSLLRGMSNESTAGLPPPSISRGATNEGMRSGTADSAVKERPVSPRKTDSTPEVKISVPQSERPSSVEGPIEKTEPSMSVKLKAREPRKTKPASDRMQKELAALGVDPSILNGRGDEFSNILDEFGWVGEGVHTRNIDEMKADIERELNKAQAGGWLARLDEEDERIEAIKKGLDVCIAESDELDGLLTLYAHELGTLNEDIAYIEAQSQGLQVQAANQKLLQTELKSLLETISISGSDLQSLKTGRWETDLDQIEGSLVILFKAMVTIDPDLGSSAPRASEDGGKAGGYGNSEIGSMRVLQEKKQIYKAESVTFLQRLRMYMKIKFPTAADETNKLLERETDGSLSRRSGRARLDSKLHDPSRTVLWKYNTLMLFARELDDVEWEQLLKLYEEAFKPIYQSEFKGAIMAWKRTARTPTGDEGDILFTHQVEKQTEGIATTARKLTVKRSQTLAKSLRSPLGDNGSRTNMDKSQDGRLNPYEVLQIALDDMVPIMISEQNFVTGFFHISSLEVQEFPDLVSSAVPDVRRFGDLRKLQPMDPNRELAKRVVQAMEELYSFFPGEMSSLIEWAIQADPLQGVGVMASIERKLLEVEESSQEYLARTLQKQHNRLAGLFGKFLNEQIRAIEDTKVKISKRKGVISFIRIFPSFSIALETMLISAEDLDIRETVNNAYARINKAMFESLKAIAKDPTALKSGADSEDKEALNSQILLIENMNHYASEVDGRNNVVLEEWKEKAEKEYDEHLDTYLNTVIKRPLEKLLERMENTEALLLKETAFEIERRPSSSNATFKRLLAEYDSKKIKSGIEALRKRIDKHFSDGDDPGLSAELVKKVMIACEKKYEDVERRLQIIIRDVYENDMPIEWTRQDVSSAFNARIR